MKMSEILRRVPATANWMVVFELAPLRALADDRLIKELMFLDPQCDLEHWSHVGLTCNGRFLAPLEIGDLVDGESGQPWEQVKKASLAEANQSWCEAFPPDQAQAFALATMPDRRKVLLHITIDGEVASAKALFREEPATDHYELLTAAGIEYDETRQHPLGAVGCYRNRVSDHIRAGVLSHFRRTDACNRFFFCHGNIDENLEQGLLKASEHRIAWKAAALANRLELTALASMQEPLAMSWLPPVGKHTFPFGTVVPMALLRGGLMAHGDSALTEPLAQWLDGQRLNGLWPFQDGDLETATDSALVLLGVDDREAVRAVDRFLASDGGYLPQITTSKKQSGTMQAEPAKLHWCQSDYGTTCAMRMHQRRYGLPMAEATTRYLLEGFESRSALYFANPFLVDWLAAGALSDHPYLRQALIDDLLDVIHPDGHFGMFDPVLSTACAILALNELGYHGRALRAAQLALTRQLGADGLPPVEVPFYSSLLVPPSSDELRIEGHTIPIGPMLDPRLISVAGRRVAVSYHADTHAMVVGGIVLRALMVKRDEEECDRLTWNKRKRPAKARYRCPDRLTYIRDIALPPYIDRLGVGQ